MNTSKLKCPKCGEVVIATYPTTLGHTLTDKALAEYDAITKHRCKEDKQNGNQRNAGNNPIQPS